MAFDAINYLIGVEEDRIINGADKGTGRNKRQSPWGMGGEEKAVRSEDQQVELIEAARRSKQEEEMKVIRCGLLFLIFPPGIINSLSLRLSADMRKLKQMSFHAARCSSWSSSRPPAGSGEPVHDLE